MIVHARTKKVIQVHHNGILCDTFPNADITRFLPIEVGQDTFCTGPIGMHQVDHRRILPKEIGKNLAKGMRKKPLAQMAGGCMNLLFLRRYTSFFVQTHDWELMQNYISN